MLKPYYHYKSTEEGNFDYYFGKEHKSFFIKYESNRMSLVVPVPKDLANHCTGSISMVLFCSEAS